MDLKRVEADERKRKKEGELSLEKAKGRRRRRRSKLTSQLSSTSWTRFLVGIGFGVVRVGSVKVVDAGDAELLEAARGDEGIGDGFEACERREKGEWSQLSRRLELSKWSKDEVEDSQIGQSRSPETSAFASSCSAIRAASSLSRNFALTRSTKLWYDETERKVSARRINIREDEGKAR